MKGSFAVALILSLIYSACFEREKAPGSRVSFSTSSGSVASLGGGVMVWAQGLGHTYSFVLPASGSMSLVLPVGTWNFYAEGWANRGFSGDTFCAVLTKKLVNAEEVIKLSMNRANCSSGAWIGAMGGVSSLRLVSCSTLGGIAQAGDSCDFPRWLSGRSQSATVELLGFHLFQKTPLKDGSYGQLSSSCMSVPSLSGADYVPAVILAGINFPLGGIGNNLQLARITLYDDASCTQHPYAFTFGDGVMGSKIDFTSPFLAQNQVKGVSIKSFPPGGGGGIATFFLPINPFGSAGGALAEVAPSFNCARTNCLVNSSVQGGQVSTMYSLHTLVESLIGFPIGSLGLQPPPGSSTNASTSGNGNSQSMLESIASEFTSGIGAFFWSQGFRHCADVPVNGNWTVNAVGDGGATATFQIINTPGDALIPVGYTGAGNYFERKMTFFVNGRKKRSYQFNCGNYPMVGMVIEDPGVNDNLSNSSNGNNQVGGREFFYDLNPGTALVRMEKFEHTLTPSSGYEVYAATRMHFKPSTGISYLWNTSVINRPNGGASNAWTGTRIAAAFDGTTAQSYTLRFPLDPSLTPTPVATATATATATPTPTATANATPTATAVATPTPVGMPVTVALGDANDAVDLTNPNASVVCIDQASNNLNGNPSVCSGNLSVVSPQVGNPLDPVQGNFSFFWVGPVSCKNTNGTPHGLGCNFFGL